MTRFPNRIDTFYTRTISGGPLPSAATRGRNRSCRQPEEFATAEDPLRYKTVECENWARDGKCSYGARCQFAHGAHELRSRSTNTAAAAATAGAFPRIDGLAQSALLLALNGALKGAINNVLARKLIDARSLPRDSPSVSHAQPQPPLDPHSRDAHGAQYAPPPIPDWYGPPPQDPYGQLPRTATFWYRCRLERPRID